MANQVQSEHFYSFAFDRLEPATNSAVRLSLGTASYLLELRPTTSGFVDLDARRSMGSLEFVQDRRAFVTSVAAPLTYPDACFELHLLLNGF